jgi:tetratricopeptide (TPR) repeat protein
MDLTARLRSIVRPAGAAPRELTYEPDTGRYEATLDLDRVADVLGGRVVQNRFGRTLVIDRRYESDRHHGASRVGDCELCDGDGLRLLDPGLQPPDGCGTKSVFLDLETTGISGGAGTVAFLVGCAWFDLGALQVRQFLLTSFAAERALLAAAAEVFDEASLLVTYNGKTFDVPVMETRWLFHRMAMPFEGVRHFDMLHPARRLWRTRSAAESPDGDGSCRLTMLERLVCGVRRAGDVPGMEIPSRYFRFLRTGDAYPLEPVLEHNRLDLISLAAVTASAVRLVEDGGAACRDGVEALALGKVYDRAGSLERAAECYRRAASDSEAPIDLRAEALYRIAVRLRRERRFEEAAEAWRALLDLPCARGRRRSPAVSALRQVAAEALAVHHEHRERDYAGARELALLALAEIDAADERRVDATEHRLARLDRKLAARDSSQLFG